MSCERKERYAFGCRQCWPTETENWCESCWRRFGPKAARDETELRALIRDEVISVLTDPDFAELLYGKVIT